MDAWLWVYLALAGLAVVQSVLVTLQMWEHRRFARNRLREVDTYPVRGPALLVIPCRGMDEGLEENLAALIGQDYGDFRVRFVVESADDPACASIRRAMARRPEVPCELLVAGKADDSGQKVHNLRAATAEIPPEIQFLAFVDSDARLRPHWLRAMVGRLQPADVAVATGYRWFFPSRYSAANLILYSINANYSLLFGPKTPDFVWGGSWAIRRDKFESLDMRQAWKGTLSDDLVATRVVRRGDGHARFEPACLVLSPLDTGWAGMFSFLRRQYIIARYYSPLWWAFALAVVGFAGLFLWGSVGLALWGLAAGSAAWWVPGGMAATLYFMTVGRGFLRAEIARRYFPDVAARLHPVQVFDTWATPLVAAVHCLALASSTVGRHITWRAIQYRIFPGGRIRLIRREDWSPAAEQIEAETGAPLRHEAPAPHFPARTAPAPSDTFVR
ncbi:MAG: glycosyltransferase [Rhodopirellula sp.]|nr:glycosyltransferase [Rhodopirellula sp.]